MPSPGLNLNQNLQLLQRLKLVLSPRMLQLLKTLHMPYPDLVDSIYKEVESNPSLEIAKQDELMNYAKALSSTKEYTTSNFDDTKPDRQLQARGPSLHDHLFDQVRLESSLDDVDLAIAERIIDAIDNRGYVVDYPKLREELMQELDVKKTRVDKVLEVVQTLEPDGVGARNLKESLLIQVREYNFEDEELRQVISDAIKYHIDDFSSQNYADIAEDLDLELEAVEYIANFIEKNLTPAPGILYRDAQDDTHFVIPSFIIREHTQEEQQELKPTHKYKAVNLEEEKGPKLRLNPQYIQMLDDPSTNEETKEYLKEKIRSAKEFIDNIEKRKQTIEKIITIINDNQEEFFEHGYFWLAPLPQKQLAQKVGVHPSTISRAVTTKYAETPQGLYPLKHLCPREFRGYSPMQIKGMLRKILKDSKNASDQKIANFFKEARNIDIKRRTVTKYRTELGEESSYERKKE